MDDESAPNPRPRPGRPRKQIKRDDLLTAYYNLVASGALPPDAANGKPPSRMTVAELTAALARFA